MSTARLREAARVLRERAEVATPGPWKADQRGGVTGRFAGMTEVISESTDQSHADYIATMHPGVALALADWLEHQSGYRRGEHVWSTNHALRVADLILGDKETR